jgi:arabinogalactan oligomer/maltooligosaccharide transport system permease protein
MMDENKNNSTDELREISELLPETQGDAEKNTINSAFGGNTVKPMNAEDTTSRKMSVARVSERGMGMKKKELILSILKNLLLAALAVFWLIPILWLVVTAFSANPGISYTRFFPEKWTLANFSRVLFHPDSVLQYGRWFLNTLIIAVFSCAISTAFILMVSYAFSCMRFPGRQGMIRFSMVLGMFPGVLSMIAVYFIMKSIGLTNSHIGMIVVYSAGSGLGYLIVKGFMDTIPVSMREAARIEGANELVIFFQVMMPLCKPIIVYQIISAFLAPWSDFVFARLMLNSGISKDWTVAIGLYNMLDKTLIHTNFAAFCAGGLIISIPISVLFIIMQKYYVEGVTSGSTKG